MLIGLDGIPLNEPRTGVGHYTLELARALAVCAPAFEFEIVSPRSFHPSLSEEDKAGLPQNLRLVEAEVNALTRHWWTIGLARYLKRRPFTLFHGTNYEVPLLNKCPTVLTIHDLSLLLYPETHEKRRVRRARLRLPLMAKAATMIVTPTESVRREVCEHLGVAAEKVVAVAEAPRKVFQPVAAEKTLETRKRLGVEDEFLLFVGTIEPRKNLGTLVNAFIRVLSQTSLRTQLVIAGQKGWLSDELLGVTDSLISRERLLFTGYVTDEELRDLYASCRAFIYPSLYEGFGLPPLEAMACGAPVVASRIAAHTEVLGTAARCFAPASVEELAENIVRLCEDESERQKLSSAGLKRAAEFSWERAARETLGVYKEALERDEAAS
ncbi:MAG: glycosyltransferase family 1 protein [Pyrinomonadaceae bacterium]